MVCSHSVPRALLMRLQLRIEEGSEMKCLVFLRAVLEHLAKDQSTIAKKQKEYARKSSRPCGTVAQTFTDQTCSGHARNLCADRRLCPIQHGYLTKSYVHTWFPLAPYSGTPPKLSYLKLNPYKYDHKVKKSLASFKRENINFALKYHFYTCPNYIYILRSPKTKLVF